jgi:UPF0755 protein
MARRGDESRPRTAEEREAARLERERRRALREGREPPEEPAPASEPAPEPASEPAPEPEPVDEPTWEPFAHEPDPEPRPVAPERSDPPERNDPAERSDPAERNGEVDDPQPTQPLEPVGTVRARRTVSLPRPQVEDLGHHTDSWDRPIGTVKVSRGDYQPQPGAPGMPPHRSIGVRGGKARRRLRRLAPLIPLTVLAGFGVVAVLLFQPFHGKGHGSVVVSIPAGASSSDIGDLLAKKGVVDSGFFFEVRARLSGDRSKLRAGTYKLKKSMSYAAALSALTAAPGAAATIEVTLPEGPSRRELAAKVRQAGVSGSYLVASQRSSLLNPRSYGAPKGSSLEGFLFPDTYELRRKGATAVQLVADQLKTFKTEFAKVDLSKARSRHLSRYDVLIIASMIEREAVVPKDRALISAVIYNRLRRGMPLGIDATLRYRLSNWTRPLKQSELNTSSAYNTRRHTGLPPTPIGNPGLASIQAAAAPAKVKYLFYVVKPCGNGAHAFSSTDAQFQKDVNAYNRARAKRGGKDPSKC